MSIGAIGPGQVNSGSPLSSRDASSLGPLASQAGTALNDTVATLLQELATPAISDLLLRIEQPRLALDAVQIETLFRAALAAVAGRDIPLALDKLTQVVALDPQKVEILPREPSLASIRGEVQGLMHRLTASVRGEAEQTIAIASRALETPPHRDLPAAELDLRDVLSVATRLFDTGQHINYLRSTELAQFVIAYYPPGYEIPVAKQSRSQLLNLPVRVARAPHMRSRLAMLWRRGPLLFLLLAWLCIGLIGGASSLIERKFWLDSWDPWWAALGVEVWAVGFLALIGLGFYSRVRNIRF